MKICQSLLEFEKKMKEREEKTSTGKPNQSIEGQLCSTADLFQLAIEYTSTGINDCHDDQTDKVTLKIYVGRISDFKSVGF